MKLKVTFYVLGLFLLNSCSQNSKTNPWIITAPAGDRFVTIDKTGETIIPNGRIVAPAGRSIVVAPHPFGLALSSDANIAVTANSGTSPLSITILKNIMDQSPEIIQIPPDVYFVDRLPVALHLFDVVLIFLASLAVAFAATIYPALQASRLEPVEAIRHE